MPCSYVLLKSYINNSWYNCILLASEHLIWSNNLKLSRCALFMHVCFVRCLSAWRALVQRSALLLRYCDQRKALALKTCLQHWSRSRQLHALHKHFLIQQFHSGQTHKGYIPSWVWLLYLLSIDTNWYTRPFNTSHLYKSIWKKYLPNMVKC